MADNEEMSNADQMVPQAGDLIETLRERAKELSCLYSIEELLRDTDRRLEDLFKGVMEAIPPGLQYPEVCQTKIVYGDWSVQPEGYKETPWTHCTDIVVQDAVVGGICFSYTEERPPADYGPFLKEEIQLIRTIADRLGHFILHQRMRAMFADLKNAAIPGREQSSWRVALELLRKTDPNLLGRVTRKMTNHLMWRGIKEARPLMQRFGPEKNEPFVGEINRPRRRSQKHWLEEMTDQTFKVADNYLSDNEILALIQKWIHEDKSMFLVKSLVDVHSPLTEVFDSLNRFRHLSFGHGINLSHPAKANVRVSLIGRFFTDQPEYINLAKKFVELEDFFALMDRVIHHSGSHGKLGGKSAGLFLAERALLKAKKVRREIGELKTPQTWYIPSDGLIDFLHHNDIEDVYEQKYKEIDEVRQEYPHIVEVFKNSHFPQEIVRGLTMALDDFGNVPLIVRSSSLLEDRLGSAFSGKYKSLFLANQGSRPEKLEALMDAVAEVYASTFGPDPIEYRASRGLLDFNEEMGIMIQQVVGSQVGPYFFPALAGVALSNNELRWSPRIRRHDGLVRIVPGLGTRAVDRLADDYPIMFAPGQPGLRINVSFEEILRYSPKWVDVINLVTNRFETVSLHELIRTYGNDIPQLGRIVSTIHDGRIRRPMGLMTDFTKEDVVVTFDGLVETTNFVEQISAILHQLEEAFETPVDIELACDGQDLYLLQCRPQNPPQDAEPGQIPEHIPREDTVFTANRYVSNGRVPDITHLVYVDPESYAALRGEDELVRVGRAVGALNKLLPKRQFVLIGPGRWGSRGDIKLGVQVTYSDISNTAMLIEVARKKGNYVPDLSFGTHFFQDLVEASIRYLPLYPDDKDVIFDEEFLRESPSVLSVLAPEFSDLSDVIRVIDMPAWTSGKIVRVAMSGDQDAAVAYLADPSTEVATEAQVEPTGQVLNHEDHFRWRFRMAEKIAQALEPARFGVEALYVFGSTKNATAGPGSDIDLLVHFRGTRAQRSELERWFEGWSLCLAEMNYLRTGYRSPCGLLDVHLVTDDDIRQRTSFAVKIDAVTDAARRLPVGPSKNGSS